MKRVIAVLMGIFISFSVPLHAGADTPFIEPIKMRVTCYAPTGNPTASGMMPKEGFCAAKREWMGKVAVVYTMDMEYLGCFEVNDTGGAKRIKDGTSIDIYRDSLSRCYDWVAQYGDYCLVQIIDADG